MRDRCAGRFARAAFCIRRSAAHIAAHNAAHGIPHGDSRAHRRPRRKHAHEL